MKKITTYAWLFVLVTSLFLIAGCKKSKAPKTNEELFLQAVQDAHKTPTAKDIFELINITPDSEELIWNSKKDKILMVTWHHFPESYLDGNIYKTGNWEMWLVSVKEFKNWYAKNSDGVEDWELRIKQLMGLPENSNHTHFSAVWVSPKDLVRPAYETDITKQMKPAFSEDFLATEKGQAFKKWFDQNAAYDRSEDHLYPWTGLGYTYDWADNGTKKGLSEFMIMKNSSAYYEVEFTKTNKEFIEWLQK